MEYPRMLYRAADKPGQGIEPVHGSLFALLTVSDADAEAAAIAGGWSLTTANAVAAKRQAQADADATMSAKLVSPDAPPTRAELQQKADELGIKVDGRWSDRKLGDVIAAALGV